MNSINLNLRGTDGFSEFRINSNKQDRTTNQKLAYTCSLVAYIPSYRTEIVKIGHAGEAEYHSYEIGIETSNTKQFTHKFLFLSSLREKFLNYKTQNRMTTF